MAVITVLFSMMTSVAMAVGFTSGSSFSASALSGSVSVQCPQGGNSTEAVFNCHKSLLEPVMYDYFVGPQGVDADTLELIVTQSTGTIRNKVVKYNAKDGVSLEKFNLWDAGLFQRPLLSEGNNLVQYKLYKAKQLLTSGEVNVVVNRAQPRACTPGNYASNAPHDCENQLTMCGRYFEVSNFCK